MWIRKATSFRVIYVQVEVNAPVSVIANTRRAEPDSALAAIGSGKADWTALIALG